MDLTLVIEDMDGKTITVSGAINNFPSDQLKGIKAKSVAIKAQCYSAEELVLLGKPIGDVAACFPLPQKPSLPRREAPKVQIPTPLPDPPPPSPSPAPVPPEPPAPIAETKAQPTPEHTPAPNAPSAPAANTPRKPKHQ